MRRSKPPGSTGIVGPAVAATAGMRTVTSRVLTGFADPSGSRCHAAAPAG
ncbi:hypothetical protein [Amycolatopsis sp. cmx-4-83]